METRPFNPTKHVASRLRTDRAISIGDIRTIKHEHQHEHQHEPDERVITLTMELSAQELMELELAIENHVKHMRKSYWPHWWPILTLASTRSLPSVKRWPTRLTPSYLRKIPMALPRAYR